MISKAKETSEAAEMGICPEEFISRGDPVLRPLIEGIGKCPLGSRTQQPFDVIVGSIVSQQLSSKATRSIIARLEAAVGKRPFRHTHFPASSRDDILACGLSRAKARTIMGVAEAIESGRLDFTSLSRTDDKRVIEHLTEYWGIGRWTAEMFLIFGLGRLDVLSTTDVGLLRAHRILYHDRFLEGEKQPTLVESAERWRPYRSVASWYMWQFLDQQ
jgi:DNA-3-methyladenine glycosylase II